MKKITMFFAITTAIAAFASSCSKENTQDKLKEDLNNTESLLVKAFQEAKSNDDFLAEYVDPNGQFTDPSVLMLDSLYHMNDSLCEYYYLTYCKEMMDGDNMMGGNMMGGDTMHGSGMMAMHTFMGDTATVNQYFRELLMIRQAHPEHHPVVQSTLPPDHESHHQ